MILMPLVKIVILIPTPLGSTIILTIILINDYNKLILYSHTIFIRVDMTIIYLWVR